MPIPPFFGDARETDGCANTTVEIFCSCMAEENCLQSRTVVYWLVCDTERLFMSSKRFIQKFTRDRSEIFNLLSAPATIFRDEVRHAHS
jgi:hypothetical protein